MFNGTIFQKDLPLREGLQFFQKIYHSVDLLISVSLFLYGKGSNFPIRKQLTISIHNCIHHIINLIIGYFFDFFKYIVQPGHPLRLFLSL